MIVADAGPLIGLARVGALELLRTLYGAVTVPSQVHEELQVSAARPGSRALRRAIKAGWLKVEKLRLRSDKQPFPGKLDGGETAAILLAEKLGALPLLIDERRGRAMAKRRGLPVFGTGAVLVAAKRRGEIESVSDILDALGTAGYRLAPALRARVVELAGEASEPG